MKHVSNLLYLFLYKYDKCLQRNKMQRQDLDLELESEARARARARSIEYKTQPILVSFFIHFFAQNGCLCIDKKC